MTDTQFRSTHEALASTSDPPSPPQVNYYLNPQQHPPPNLQKHCLLAMEAYLNQISKTMNLFLHIYFELMQYC
jgi:hypothetical protein